jgi:hypothetical protein
VGKIIPSVVVACLGFLQNHQTGLIASLMSEPLSKSASNVGQNCGYSSSLSFIMATLEIPKTSGLRPAIVRKQKWWPGLPGHLFAQVL